MKRMRELYDQKNATRCRATICTSATWPTAMYSI